MAKQTLSGFKLLKDGAGYMLQIEDEAGNAHELAVTREQLDVIADNLDELLDETEAEDEI